MIKAHGMCLLPVTAGNDFVYPWIRSYFSSVIFGRARIVQQREQIRTRRLLSRVCVTGLEHGFKVLRNGHMDVCMYMVWEKRENISKRTQTIIRRS